MLFAIEANGRMGRDWGNECLRGALGLGWGILERGEAARGEDTNDGARPKGEGYADIAVVAILQPSQPRIGRESKQRN